ncbi:hypothetical protein EXIGLDRAFT_654962 [Exidia glandulosa HHB12029]|uniref:N-acetyltransferase domain-containing protein n=1 Tax=Exidia glandulosa HHB12029 TaxID=1314781 RepID=A0A165DGR1_EXIGL|nr:hypothetical protein EXIGLDRAFT_654962 [Exidia glandulosa HHB12029]
MHRKVMAERPHISLHILATLPAYQGQGAASALLHHLTAEADANSLPAYLEAAPGSVPVYEKFGFVAVDTITLPALPDRAEEWEVIMLREPEAPHGLDP